MSKLVDRNDWKNFIELMIKMAQDNCILLGAEDKRIISDYCKDGTLPD
jgi:hypothetical protein